MEQTEIQKKIKGLTISRIPDWAKEIFVAMAQEEFCNDYGMCLASMVKECGEYRRLKQLFFEGKMNLGEILDGQTEDGEKEKSIKLANGSIIKYPGRKKQ